MAKIFSPSTGGSPLTVALDPHEALRSIPAVAGADYRLSALDGGLTNRSFKVETGGCSFVLRLDDRHTPSFGIRRSTELIALGNAAAAGIAPRIVFSDSARGILLCDYLSGSKWQRQDLDVRQNLTALAELCRTVHALPALGVSFDAASVAARYAESLHEQKETADMVSRCMRIAEDSSAGDPFVCCHNDLVVENVIAGDRLMLLDWEYACNNDPLFDLASVICYHDLQPKQADNLLSAYTGRPAAADRERLEAQMRLFDAIQWLWFAVRNSISPTTRLAARLETLQQRIL